MTASITDDFTDECLRTLAAAVISEIIGTAA